MRKTNKQKTKTKKTLNNPIPIWLTYLQEMVVSHKCDPWAGNNLVQRQCCLNELEHKLNRKKATDGLSIEIVFKCFQYKRIGIYQENPILERKSKENLKHPNKIFSYWFCQVGWWWYLLNFDRFYWLPHHLQHCLWFMKLFARGVYPEI